MDYSPLKWHHLVYTHESSHSPLIGIVHAAQGETVIVGDAAGNLNCFFAQVYARRQSTEARRAAVSDILSSHCLDTLQAPYDQWIQPILESVPVGFSLTIGKYCKDSRSTAFEREIALLKHIRGAYSSTEVSSK